jgi:hypothetical protein
MTDSITGLDALMCSPMPTRTRPLPQSTHTPTPQCAVQSSHTNTTIHHTLKSHTPHQRASTHSSASAESNPISPFQRTPPLSSFHSLAPKGGKSVHFAASAAVNPIQLAALAAVNPIHFAASAAVNPIQLAASAAVNPNNPPPLQNMPLSLPHPESVSPPISSATGSLLTDRLGKLVQQATEALQIVSFRDLCIRHRGPSCLTGHTLIPHPAADLLRHLRDAGAPVRLSGLAWTTSDLDAAVRRGAHKSTLHRRDFLREEFADMMEAGQWLVVKYSAIRHLVGLRLSPTGVVPQRDRRDRTIVDYSFYSVNQETLLSAPDSLQFGYAILRILQSLQRADTRRGTIYLAKIDVADAFMRVAILASHVPALGALLPFYPGEEKFVAFPFILSMGWVESPHYLCAVSETVADMANTLFAKDRLSSTPHRLDELANSRPASMSSPCDGAPSFSVPPPIVQSRGPLQRPLNLVDVYMDDFILVSQRSRSERIASRRTVFECIDSVLRPLSPGDNPKRKEPNSTKKLAQGDAAWSTRKTILGWHFDTKCRTIELPPHRLDRLNTILDSFPRHQSRTSRRKWQQLLGELRSMVMAIPGGRGLFSQLQSVLTYDNNPKPTDRLRLSPAVHDQLADFRWLVSSFASRPTRWGELVDSDPIFLGTVDASGSGMGGVWLDPSGKHAPLMWRFPFPDHLISRLVSSDNPTGNITNSDLEQTGTVCHQDILSQQHDIREATICSMTDNTAALFREQRGSTSVDDPAAYLCRLSSFHQRCYRYRLRISYIPGPFNIMADALSRNWDMDDSQVLLHFNSHFPQAQQWHLCQLRPEMSSAVLLALS